MVPSSQPLAALTKIEAAVPFAASRLWQLQRHTWPLRCRNGWRDAAVHQGVLPNPAMAAATAEGLLAFRLDRLGWIRRALAMC
jgi:hypothetical protein